MFYNNLKEINIEESHLSVSKAGDY